MIDLKKARIEGPERKARMKQLRLFEA